MRKNTQFNLPAIIGQVQHLPGVDWHGICRVADGVGRYRNIHIRASTRQFLPTLPEACRHLLHSA